MYNTVLYGTCTYFSEIVYSVQIQNICTKTNRNWSGCMMYNSSTELSIGKIEKSSFKNERLLFRGHD